jgi:phage shock protein PspC (stress-responsive transcriptional regulator)
MRCPYCRTDIPDGALRCGACTSWIPERSPVREWRRARQGKMLGGVARGLSDHYGLPVAGVRLLFVLAALFGFCGLVAYLLLWYLMPLEPELPRPAEAAPRPAVP